MSRYLSKDSIASSVLDRVSQYVLDHAPLLHLYSTDPYRPSSLAAHLIHTTPWNDKFEEISVLPPTLTLHDLDRLDTVTSGGESVYLTSNDDITQNPAWLRGVDVVKDKKEKTSVVIVVPRPDLGRGTEDVFYFYFFSFNWGGVVLEKQLGDHVGDWEHSMIRFVAGKPKYVWLSQHSNGEAYTFACLQKDSTGKRPILYCANGSHALYATPGQHDHTIPNLNLPFPFLLVDQTDAGPRYDPVPASYYYEYTGPSSSASAGTFTAYSDSDPVGYLRFAGQWGDQEYPEDDLRQKAKGLLGFKKYVSGPTGPLKKDLIRKEVWPQNEFSGGQTIRKRLPGSEKTWVEDKLEKVGKFFEKCCGIKKKETVVPPGQKKVNVDGRVIA